MKTPQEIIGESFDGYVSKQIELRQTKLGQIQKDNKILTYESGKSPWIRLCSSVDLDSTKASEFASKYASGQNLTGNQLAKYYMLFGGVSMGDFGTENWSPKQLKGGVANTYNVSYIQQNAYGFDSTNQYGLSPMPGVTSIDVVSQNQGSLREATIKITCYNISQFETIELLFLRLKYTILLEWGHSMYFENGTQDLRTTPAVNDVYDKFLNVSKLDPPQGQTYLRRVLDYIEAQRESSSGNYDGFLGWVTNYEWEMQPNGIYNITIKAISHGDIIESLTVTTPRSDESGGDEVKEQNKANNSTLGRILNALKKALDGDDLFTAEQPGFPVATSDLTSTNGVIISYFQDKETTSSSNIANLIKLKNKPYINPFYNMAGEEVVRIAPTMGEGKNFYYITLGALLRLIESFCLTYDKLGIPTFNIYWSYEGNYTTNADPYIMSSDINTCWAFGEIAFAYPGEDYNSAKASTKRISYIGDQFYNSSVSRLYYMYAFLNIDFLLTTLIDNIDSEGNLSVYDFLSAILTAMNGALANYINLEPYYDSTTHNLYIIDRSTPVKPNNPPTLLNVGLVKPNQGTFVKSFSVKSEITPNLASQIAIGAQANNEDVGVESIAFSRWNAGLTDRIVPNKIVPKNSTENSDNFLGLKKDTISYLTALGSGVWMKNYVEELSPSVNDYQKQTKASRILANPKAASPSFIPISLNLTLDGISGIKIFQKYTITEDYLPKSYRDNIEFIIKGISNTVDPSGWTTKIEGLSIPKGSEALSGGVRTSEAGAFDSNRDRSVSTNDGGSVATPNSAGLTQPTTGGKIVHDYTGQAGQNVQLILDALNAVGLTNPISQVGVLCTVSKECGFLLKGEIGYNNTSNERIRKIFKTKLGKQSDAFINDLKKDKVRFFSYVYSDNYGGLGNGSAASKDGWTYRGRGFNGLTGRAIYKKYGDLVGVDILNNPDLVNKDLALAAKILVQFLVVQPKNKGSYTVFQNTQQAILKFADLNNGGTPNTMQREKALQAERHFKIVG